MAVNNAAVNFGIHEYFWISIFVFFGYDYKEIQSVHPKGDQSWVFIGRTCKTQNSGLHSKEEKPRDPINQPSRCNTQEGLLSIAQTGDSDLLGGRAHRTANWASFICSMLHTGYKVIGYTFAKQSYWHKLLGLHVYKAILLAQTSRAFVQI